MGISNNALTSVPDIRDFMFGGQAEFTLHSIPTGKHFTYRIINHSSNPEHSIRFVFFLGGSDNDSDWVYAGTLKRFFTHKDGETKYTGQLKFNHTARSPDPGSAVMQAFGWMVHMLNKNTVAADQIEFMHTGRCSACGRKLTTPESIRTGLGPVCRSKL